MADSPTTLTDRVRRITAKVVSGAGSALHRAGIHPDTLTILGLGSVALAAVFIGAGQLQVGGLILLLGLPLDALDGAVARAMQRTDQFGGVLDSTLDRYADGFIFGALGYYFASLGQQTDLLLALAALVGSYGVSYVRARAGEAGLSVKVGLLTRMERVVIILVALLVPPLLVPGLWILAVGTNITALQRLWFVYRSMQQKM
ncbi:MAG: CDP-alcohol phosphatidyltransferase family protein [Anaerolineae bacterium]|nr:CDP-alcohol phosphatidyltransferase family protein [Anaerolineae bacterium]